VLRIHLRSTRSQGRRHGRRGIGIVDWITLAPKWFDRQRRCLSRRTIKIVVVVVVVVAILDLDWLRIAVILAVHLEREFLHLLDIDWMGLSH
jgi:hypothetical protein